MSYILDALKKADAERERGTVPGLHSQPQAPAADETEPRRTSVPLVWLGAGGALCLIALLSWQLWSRSPGPAPTQALGPDMQGVPPTPANQVDGPPAMPPGPQTPRSSGTGGGDATMAPSPAIAQAQGTGETQPQQRYGATPPPVGRSAEHIGNAGMPLNPPPNPMPRQPANARADDGAGMPPPAAQPAQPPALAGAANTQGGSATAPAGREAVTPAQARLPSASELPEEIRRELPALVVGGAMYSETPASRMLIINSQVFREGDQPSPGLVLEEIRLKSAVFRYRGHRYGVNY